MTYRPGLIELDAVVAIVREGSFRGAARALGLSTTALSNAVAKLETGIGVRLFNRTTRSVSLTDAGRTFIEQMGPALRDIHGAIDTARSQQVTPSGTLRINAFAAGAREIMTDLVLEFLHRYPEVHVDLVTEERLTDIVAEGFDLGLRRSDLVPADMIAVSLGRLQRYAVVGSPGYIERHGLPGNPAAARVVRTPTAHAAAVEAAACCAPRQPVTAPVSSASARDEGRASRRC